MESGFTITAAGWRKLARMVAGDTLHITRVAVGKGVLPEENKKNRLESGFFIMGIKKLFLSVFHVGFIPVHEFIDTTCGVNQFHLTCIERM